MMIHGHFFLFPERIECSYSSEPHLDKFSVVQFIYCNCSMTVGPISANTSRLQSCHMFLVTSAGNTCEELFTASY